MGKEKKQNAQTKYENKAIYIILTKTIIPLTQTKVITEK
jgi:hypothetical protein